MRASLSPPAGTGQPGIETSPLARWTEDEFRLLRHSDIPVAAEAGPAERGCPGQGQPSVWTLGAGIDTLKQ